MQHKYDVIIVGAGPAGTVLAYELASKGTRTLVLEKAKFPRYKCCAGGLTVKAANLLGINLNEAVEDIISAATVSFAGRDHYHSVHDQMFMYTVMRQKFDHILTGTVGYVAERALAVEQVVGHLRDRGHMDPGQGDGSPGIQYAQGFRYDLAGGGKDNGRIHARRWAVVWMANPLCSEVASMLLMTGTASEHIDAAIPVTSNLDSDMGGIAESVQAQDFARLDLGQYQ